MAKTRTTGTAGSARSDTRRRSGKTRQAVNTPATPEPILAAAPPDDPAANPLGKPARPSKKSTVIALLQRPDGAAINELIAVTGWLPHTVRAALTGLRKEGKELVRAKNESGVTHYRLTAEA